MSNPRLALFRRLAPILVGFTVLSLVVTAFWPGLGLNLLADSIGLWFVTFVVDVAVQENRKRSQAPLVLAAEREGAAILGTLRNVLRAGLEGVVVPGDLEGLQQSCASPSAAVLGGILHRMPFTRRTHFVHKVPGGVEHRQWADVLIQADADLKHRLDQFIPRYGAVVEPALIEAIQRLETSEVLGLVPALQAFGHQQFPDAAPWVALVDVHLQIRRELLALRVAGGLTQAPDWPPLVDQALVDQLQNGGLPATYPGGVQPPPQHD